MNEEWVTARVLLHKGYLYYFNTYFARAPSGSVRLMAASGPSNFSKWLETNCCFNVATCFANATGVSFSSVADSLTVLYVEKLRIMSLL